MVYFEILPRYIMFLQDLDSSDVATVLHFLYYGELKLNVYNILGVRSAVQALGVTDLPPVIQEFHDKLFTSPNMINLIEFAQAKKLQDLFTYSWKLFVAMFYEHINGSHFLNWDVRWVLNLLSHENLPIKVRYYFRHHVQYSRKCVDFFVFRLSLKSSK